MSTRELDHVPCMRHAQKSVDNLLIVARHDVVRRRQNVEIVHPTDVFLCNSYSNGNKAE